MWPNSKCLDDMISCIQLDIATFSNPGSVIIETIPNGKAVFNISWETGRRESKATFRVDPSGAVTVTSDGVKSGYRDFLATESMADLQLLATRIVATLPETDSYVPTRCKVDDEEVIHSDAVQFFAEIVQTPILADNEFIEATRLLFLRAPAGAGKSVTMRMLAKKQAEKYLRGEDNYLYFYVDAQGRALARLEEAFALELQKLVVSSIRFNTVEALVRNRLLIPIIDGFDELVGSGGFADAFTSLSAFLSSLNKQGTVIATGRSAFYDDKKFAMIADRYSKNNSLNYRMTTMELKLWDRDELEKYAENVFSEDQKKARRFLTFYDHANEQNRSLMSKPFFASQFAAIIDTEEFTPEQNVDLVDQLVTHLLHREANKLKTKQGDIVLSPNGHRYLLRELALEMWWQELRHIDLESLQTIADLVGDNFNLPPEQTQILYDRISSHAFLKTSDEHIGIKRSFENEVYYDYFLLDAMLMMLSEDDAGFSSFLSRSLLGESLLEYFCDKAKNLDSGIVENMISSISTALTRSRAGSLERRNGGGLFAAIVRGRTDIRGGFTVNHIEIYKEDMGFCRLENVRFKNCFFQDVKFYNSHLLGCQFDDSIIDRMYLNDETLLTDSALIPGENVTSIVYDTEPVYDPSKIYQVVTRHGAKTEAIKVLELTREQQIKVKLIERFCRRIKTCLYIDLEAKGDPLYKNIVNDRNWYRAKDLLEKHEILLKKLIDRSGPRPYLYKLAVDHDELLKGLSYMKGRLSNKISEFWVEYLFTE